MWIRCRCGRTFRDGSHDYRVEGRMIGHADWQRMVVELVEAASKIARIYAEGGGKAVADAYLPAYPHDGALHAIMNDVLYAILSEHARPQYQCPRCGRLLVNPEPWNFHLVPEPRTFVPEDPPIGVFGLTDADRAAEAERLAREDEPDE